MVWAALAGQALNTFGGGGGGGGIIGDALGGAGAPPPAPISSDADGTAAGKHSSQTTGPTINIGTPVSGPGNIAGKLNPTALIAIGAVILGVAFMFTRRKR